MARMDSVAKKIEEQLENVNIPHLKIKTDDNIMSSILISGSFDPKETWVNNIYENSRHFRFQIVPPKGERWYENQGKVEVKLIQKSHEIKGTFRKSTSRPEKVGERIQKWILESQSN